MNNNELFSAAELFADGPKGTKLQYGIHTEVTVKSISRKETPNKNKFVEILFEKDGASIAKALWEPKGSYPQDGETLEDAKAREAKNNIDHIAKLLKIYLTPEQKASFPNLTYDNLIDKAIVLLTPVLPSKKVNLKVIYDAEGVYTELPKFAYPEYLEEFVEGEEPKLKFSPYEIQNRSTPKEKSTATKKNSLEDLLG